MVNIKRKSILISLGIIVIVSFLVFFQTNLIINSLPEKLPDTFIYQISKSNNQFGISFNRNVTENDEVLYFVTPSTGSTVMMFLYSINFRTITQETYYEGEVPLYIKKKNYGAMPLSLPIETGKSWDVLLNTIEYSTRFAKFNSYNDTLSAKVEKSENLKVGNENLKTLVVHFNGSKNEFWWWISDRFALPVKIVSVTDGETITTVLKEAPLAPVGFSLPLLSENQRLGSLAIGILSTLGIIAILVTPRKKENGMVGKSESVSKITSEAKNTISNQNTGSTADVIEVKIKTQPASKPTQSSLPVKSNSKDDIIEVKLKKK